MPAVLQVDTSNSLGNYPPLTATQLCNLENCVEQWLVLPVTKSTADAAVLFTVPTGLRVKIGRAFWEITTSWSGGSSSAIGVSSSNSNYSTKGDLLGGATGDVAAGLVTTLPFAGTIGAKAASQGVIVLNAGDTVRFDRITSVFTAGAGNVILPVAIIPAS